MSQSKLTISSSLITYDALEKEDFSLDHKFYLHKLDRIDPVKGLPEKKVSANSRQSTTDKPNLYVTLNNKGELASGNARVTLLFRGYGSKVKEEVNEHFFEKYLYFLITSRAQVIMKNSAEKRKLFLEKKITIDVPYIAADEKVHFVLTSLNDQFRESELVLIKIKANGHTYFKQNLFERFFNPIVINHQVHPYMDEVKDFKELRILFGSDNPDKRFKHAYAVKGGIFEWLRNLYAEWQRLRRRM